HLYANQALAMNSYRETIRGAALRSLAEVGDDSAFNTIKSYLPYGKPRDLRVSSLRLLSRNWKEKDEVVDLTIGLINDPMMAMRRAAVDVLGTLHNKKAIEPLQQLAAKETDERLGKQIKDVIERLQKDEKTTK
ncbi:MAG TPA: HEAT repeat domain-containing protein, partial [Bacteroidota bacterium]|nr:HEAT repeat domain-containing protein [Bacteroidota bacterium]